MVDLLELVDMLALGSREQKTSYATPLKLVALGKVMGLGPDTRIIDLGCAKADALILWGKYFGISGVGIETSRQFCDIADDRLKAGGLSDQIQITCGDAAVYPVQEGAFDVACCIGASFIWGGFRPTIKALKRFIHARGMLVVGEPYYTEPGVPEALIEFEGDYHTEVQLLEIMNEEGFGLKQIFRASNDDRDWYTAFWSQHGQRMYLEYMRRYEGFAIYLLSPSGTENEFKI